MTVVSRARSKALILAGVFSCPLIAVAVLFYFKSVSQRRTIADHAIYAAQTSSQLAALVGLPMQTGARIRGNFVSKSGSGNADLQIPLSGPQGNGTLLEWAQQDHGQWHICSLEFRSGLGDELKIVDPVDTHCEPE